MGFREDLKKYLIDTTGAKQVSGGNELLLRCPYCGDSGTKSSAHLYIGPFNDKSDKPIFFHCMRCNESNIVDSGFLRTIDAYDFNVATDLTSHQKKYAKPAIGSFDKHLNSYNLRNSFITDNNISKIKLDYLNLRLGTQLTYANCLNLKIVLNLGDILCCNNITSYTRNMQEMQELNDYFIGFLSKDNGYVCLRNLEIASVSKYIDRRYTDYNIFGSYSNSGRFYAIPATVDILSPEPIRIFIAEGAIDILSLYLNTENPKNNSIYVASLGKAAYLNTIRYFISQLGIINTEIHLCLDNDISEWEVNKLVSIVANLDISVYIHKNLYQGEKDFGVPKDRIKEYVYLAYKSSKL